MVQIERRLETPEEAAIRRERDRIRKQKSRERLAATRFEDFDVWTWNWDERYPAQYAELREHEQAFRSKVAEELDRKLPFPGPEDFTLDRLIVCLVALRKKDRPWICRTTEGIVAAGRYPLEGIAIDLIHDSYRLGLKQSSTYSQSLTELLTLLLGFEFPNGMARSEKLIIEQELSGVYEFIPRQLPKKPEPSVAEPPKEKPLPSWQDHMNTQAEKFLRQTGEDEAARERREQMINDGMLPEAARRYLNGY